MAHSQNPGHDDRKLESRLALRRRLKAGVFMALLGVQAAVGMASPAKADASTPAAERSVAQRAESVRVAAESLNLDLGGTSMRADDPANPWLNLWTNWNNWKNWNNWSNWSNAWNNWGNAWNNWHNVWYNV